MRAAWLVINPIFVTVIFTVVFSKIARLPSEGVPYPLFSFTGLIFWIAFSSTLSYSCVSLRGNRHLINRLKFDRVALPVSAVLTKLVDLAIYIAALIALLIIYGRGPSVALVYFLPIFLVQLLLTFGLSFILSIANAYVRDTSNAFPIILQAWMLCSPVVYSIDAIDARVRPLYMLNPMAGIIESYKRILLHQQSPNPRHLLTAFVVSLVIFLAGLFIFKKFERNLDDVL